MANTAFSLVYLVKVDGEHKRFPVQMSKNGRVRTGWITVGGVERNIPGGRFQIRSFEGRKTIYVNAGTDAVEALAKRDLMAKRARLVEQAKDAGIALDTSQDRKVFSSEVIRFIKRCTDTEAKEAAVVYGTALANFRTCSGVTYVDEIDEAELVRFGAYLRKQGNSARTVHNKHNYVLTFLRWCGVDVKALRVKTPKYETKMPVVYSDEQVTTLKGATDRYMQTVIDVLRMTGLREMEAVHLEWADIDYGRKLVHVRSKPEYGHAIKDKEERDVPLPDALVKVLTAWRAERDPDGKQTLVLGTAKDKPQTKWLRLIKRAALDAGINCGRCDGCKSDRQECQGYTLHSFRRTYATSLSRKGIDVRTLMDLLGHSDVETTMRYLRPLNAENAHPQVNAAFD